MENKEYKEYKWDWNKENPENNGYKKVKLSREFVKRNYVSLHWYDRIICYEGNVCYKVHRYYSFLYKLINIILFPLYIFHQGVPETIKDFKRMLFQNKYGSFYSDCIWKCKLK